MVRLALSGLFVFFGACQALLDSPGSYDLRSKTGDDPAPSIEGPDGDADPEPGLLPTASPIACGALDVLGDVKSGALSPLAAGCGGLGLANYYMFVASTAGEIVRVDVDRTSRVSAYVVPTTAVAGDPCLAVGRRATPAVFTTQPGASYYVIAASLTMAEPDSYELEVTCD